MSVGLCMSSLEKFMFGPSAHFFFSFLWPHPRHMEVPELGLNWRCSCEPTPQPHQHWIWAASVTYPAACSNTGTLTHWVRPGIEPASLQRQHWVLNLLSHNWNSFLTHFLIGFFILSFMTSLYILDINTLWDISFANISLHFVNSSLCHVKALCIYTHTHTHIHTHTHAQWNIIQP